MNSSFQKSDITYSAFDLDIHKSPNQIKMLLHTFEQVISPIHFFKEYSSEKVMGMIEIGRLLLNWKRAPCIIFIILNIALFQEGNYS